jgi:hypothetical protein
LFLRGRIPESGRVVLPPNSFVGEVGPFAYVTFIQYFMLPREVVNCSEPVAECVRRLTADDLYVVQIGRFPPADAAFEHKGFVRFDDERGLYVPE